MLPVPTIDRRAYSSELDEWTRVVRDLAVSLMEGRVNNLFSSICGKLTLHARPPEQLSSNVNHYLNLSPCRPRQKQCFPFPRRSQSKRWFIG
jgi:hypothetical protein